MYCPHRNDYNLNSGRLENVIVSEIFAKLIPLGIPKCSCNPRVFPRNCYISRESVRLEIKKCNCNCNHQKINSRKTKIVACIHFDDEGNSCRPSSEDQILTPSPNPRIP